MRLKAALLALSVALPSTAFAAAPDIAVDEMWADVIGGDVFVSMKIVNEGDANTGSFYVDLYGAKEGDWAYPSHITHQYKFQGSMVPGQTTIVTFELTADQWFDNAPLFGTVDVDESIAESDEGNNLGRLYILDQFPGEPALACGNLNVPFPALLAGAPFMSAAFLADQQPHLTCKSRVL